MRTLSAIALLVAAGALGACDDKYPKPEMESRPPATGGMEAPPPPTPGSQMPAPEPSPANPAPSPQPGTQ